MSTIATAALLTATFIGFAQIVVADDLADRWRPVPGEAKGRSLHSQDMRWMTHGLTPPTTDDVRQIRGVTECPD